MPRKFDTPDFFKSDLISSLKRRDSGVGRKDFSPIELEMNGINFRIARHFGFCFGVENAIEIAFKAVKENPGKRVFLLSEMIHNPLVNRNLLDQGVQFLQKPDGTQIVPFDNLQPEDVVILPAFGVTVETLKILESRGVDPQRYNATCPFVEKVWKRSAQLGQAGYSVIIHGKHFHEETRATFSHAALNAHSVVIRNISEAHLLGRYILGEADPQQFFLDFKGKFTEGFDPNRDLIRLGVVNQTTMLAEETREIGEYIRSILEKRFGSENLSHHYADTRDTLCYATSENQSSVKSLIEGGGDLAIVVGGYNSSNTAHLARLCSSRVPATFHIQGADDIRSSSLIRHIPFGAKEPIESHNWFVKSTVGKGPTVLVTAGASTPDSTVQEVIERIAEFYGDNNGDTGLGSKIGAIR